MCQPRWRSRVARRSWREISLWKTQHSKNSLNFVSTCLRVVDARRSGQKVLAASIVLGKTHIIASTNMTMGPSAIDETFAKLKLLKVFDFYKTRVLTQEQQGWKTHTSRTKPFDQN